MSARSRVWSNNIGTPPPTSMTPDPSDHEVGQETEDQPLLTESKEMEVQLEKSGNFCSAVRPYSLWVLCLLLLAYLLNQLDRYMLAITAKDIAQELHFGDRACEVNSSAVPWAGKKGYPKVYCNATAEASCLQIAANGTKTCSWVYTGQGWAYQVLAGPVFILVYTLAGILVAFLADRYNRKMLLAACLAFWSVMTLLTGFAQEYWQLALLRFGLGLGEAGCTPFASSLIADYFSPSQRGTALGVYNFGIYLGYSLSYAVGNFITLANLTDWGWRWAFILPGLPGVLLGLVIALTVAEPVRPSTAGLAGPGNQGSWLGRLRQLAKAFIQPPLLLLCLGGSIRNAGGYVWAYNTQPYFDAAGVPKTTTGSYLSWIPLVSGCVGVLVGGFISDRLVKNRGVHARLFVLIASQLLAAPFAAGALYLDTPWAFISLIPANVIGEMWVSVCLAVVLEVVSPSVVTSAVAAYLFIITNIGGNVPLLVPPLKEALKSWLGLTPLEGLRGALYVLYPGMFAFSSVFFVLAMIAIKRDQAFRSQYQEIGSTQ